MQNAEMRRRVTSTRAVTDDDVSDEAAGMAREAMANKLMANREAKAAQLAAENAEAREKLRNVTAKVDDDIADEAAGAARKQLAAAARRDDVHSTVAAGVSSGIWGWFGGNS